MGGERGQASLEYVGVLALVCLVLALPQLVPGRPGESVAGAVVRGMHRALCVVRAGECDLDQRPCAVRVRDVESEATVDLVVLRVGSKETVLREDRSDGTTAVTFLREHDGGLELSTGLGAQVRIGRRGLRVGVEASATVLGLLGSATTWVLPGRAPADRLVDRLVVDDARDLGRRLLDGGGPAGDDVPPPAWRSSHRGVGVSLGGALSNLGGRAGLTLSSTDIAGSTVEVATGRRTFLVRRRNDLAAAVGPAHGELAGDELYTVTVDRAGRPVDLGVLSGGELSGSVDVPARLAGILPTAPSAARRWETEEHLDLTEPSSLAAARAFLRQVVVPHPHFGRIADVSAGLRGVLDERGVLDARVYELSDATGGLAGGARTPIGKAGAGYERRERRERLVGAVQRGPDGLWRRRTECVS